MPWRAVRGLPLGLRCCPSAVRMSSGRAGHNGGSAVAIRNYEEMENIQSTLQKAFESALNAAFPQASNSIPAIVTRTKKAAGALDYQCATAFDKRLHRLLEEKPQGNPARAVADRILQHLPRLEQVKHVEVGAAGFINVELCPSWMFHRGLPSLACAEQRTSHAVPSKRALVDYGSPNMAKELHVGHLRSMVIGESMCRLLERVGGYDVIRISHVGDFGTPMGLVLAYCERIGKELNTESLTTTELNSIYVSASQLSKKDCEFMARALEVTNSLQRVVQQEQWAREGRSLGDDDTPVTEEEKELGRQWKVLCSVSSSAFHDVYKWFDIHPEDRGESYYAGKLASTIAELKEKQLLTNIEGNARAVIVDLQYGKNFTEKVKKGKKSKKKAPGDGENNTDDATSDALSRLVVQKSDGSFLYATTDLAAVKQRVEEENCDRIVYVTDGGQQLHFQQVFAVAKAAGWLRREGKEDVVLQHSWFGTVKGEDGSRLRTRTGAPIPLQELIRQAEEATAKATADSVQYMSEEDQKNREAQAGRVSSLSMAAIKYFDLSNWREKDYVFSFDAMLQFKGNTAIYLAYALSRITSILSKAEARGVPTFERLLQRRSGEESPSSNPDDTFHSTRDRVLALALLRYPEALERAHAALAPHVLCDYLYEVATEFHTFYEHCPVLHDDVSPDVALSRLRLCGFTRLVLQDGLLLLGIKPSRA